MSDVLFLTKDRTIDIASGLVNVTENEGVKTRSLPTTGPGAENLSLLFSPENSLTRYQFATPGTTKITSGTLETIFVTVTTGTYSTISIPAPETGNTTSLAVVINDGTQVRDVVLDVTNNDSNNDCPIGISDNGVARVFDGAEAIIPKGSRAIVTLTKLSTPNEWLVSVNALKPLS